MLPAAAHVTAVRDRAGHQTSEAARTVKATPGGLQTDSSLLWLRSRFSTLVRTRRWCSPCHDSLGGSEADALHAAELSARLAVRKQTLPSNKILSTKQRVKPHDEALSTLHRFNKSTGMHCTHVLSSSARAQAPLKCVPCSPSLRRARGANTFVLSQSRRRRKREN